jgi:hypothetical protein
VIQHRRSPDCANQSRSIAYYGSLACWTCSVRMSEFPPGEATTIARHVEAGDRPIKEYELCAPHAESVAERENG